MNILKLLIPQFLRQLLKSMIYKFRFNQAKIDCTAGVNKFVAIKKGVVITQYCRINNNVSIGEYSHINHNTIIDSGQLGKFCSVGPYCHIGAGLHSTNHITTSHYYQMMIDPKFKFQSFPNPPNIGSDVWIGSHVCIMQNVNVGDGAVIGAGSVVTKDILPFAIAVGNPAKTIKYRFTPEEIRMLLNRKWWDTECLDSEVNLFTSREGFKKHL